MGERKDLVKWPDMDLVLGDSICIYRGAPVEAVKACLRSARYTMFQQVSWHCGNQDIGWQKGRAHSSRIWLGKIAPGRVHAEFVERIGLDSSSLYQNIFNEGVTGPKMI